MNLRHLLHSMLAALALGGFSSHSTAHGLGNPPSSLQGAWNVTITPYVCATGESLPISFVSHLIFSAGGTASETTSNPFFEPGQRSPGYGYWKRVGPGAYHSVIQAFIQFTSSSTPPGAPGYTRGTQVIDQAIDIVDRNHWKSTASVSFFDESGTLVPPSGCMTAVGERFR
jgi:hypothetical protein